MQIVTTHKNTDFDALASMIAATMLYPGLIAACPRNVNPNVHRFLSLHKTAFELVLMKEVEIEKIERLVVVDTNQWRRLDRAEQLQECKNMEVLLWDHHISIGDIEATWQCVEKVGATTTLLLREIQARKVQLTPLQATLFLLGIYEDTGQLTFTSTTPEDMRTAAYLLEQGADLSIAVVFLNMAYGEVQKKVLFRLIRHAVLHEIKGKQVGIGVVEIDRHAELSMVVQLYAKIVDADAVFVIFINTEEDKQKNGKNINGLFIIGRSNVPEINVHSILQRFGGGGHPGAGSATVNDPRMEAGLVRQKLIAALHEIQRGGALVADMMSFPVTTVAPSTPMHEVKRIMEEKNIRGIVIAEEDRLQGIIVLWDLKRLSQVKQWNSPVKAFMNRKVTTIKPDALASETANLMAQKNIGHLPVVLGEKVIGIVTRTDVINYLYGMLPT